ncbi:phosphopantetheine-binding protein [Caulobacter segnis]|uniref:Carrier domain-containing protein n=1 Tax=Caulobacter segnis TaxID=88688 RepID=A0A2W5WQP7_9CAUL|nr:acyl carrier protein [Caulobacter segnis]PZR36458.1 MAG: hypothetical protein DI526_03200 [Caulobacter segnis]
MTTDTTIAGRVRRIIAGYSNRDAAILSAADTLHELGLGDLESIEISLDIEEIVDAEGSDDAWEQCQTVGDFIKYAEKLAGVQAMAA